MQFGSTKRQLSLSIEPKLNTLKNISICKVERSIERESLQHKYERTKIHRFEGFVRAFRVYLKLDKFQQQKKKKTAKKKNYE